MDDFDGRCIEVEKVFVCVYQCVDLVLVFKE